MMFIAGLLALLAVCEAFQTTVSSGARKGVSSLFMGAKSKSLPFLPQPTQLVGLPGSAGRYPSSKTQRCSIDHEEL